MTPPASASGNTYHLIFSGKLMCRWARASNKAESPLISITMLTFIKRQYISKWDSTDLCASSPLAFSSWRALLLMITQNCIELHVSDLDINLWCNMRCEFHNLKPQRAWNHPCKFYHSIYISWNSGRSRKNASESAPPSITRSNYPATSARKTPTSLTPREQGAAVIVSRICITSWRQLSLVDDRIIIRTIRNCEPWPAIEDIDVKQPNGGALFYKFHIQLVSEFDLWDCCSKSMAFISINF